MPGYNPYMPLNPYVGYNGYYSQYQSPAQAFLPPQGSGASMSVGNPAPVQSVQSQAALSPASNPSTIIWVNGEKEAAMFPVTPNSAIALWDSGNPVIFLKQADASGKPSMKTFDLVERVDAQQNTANSSGIDLSAYAAKADLAVVAGLVSNLSKDIDVLKDEMANLASQAVKRAVGAKSKPTPTPKEPLPEDEE